MDKSPEAFRTISEVAEVLDVPPHVLRFWETRFTQVKPVKRGGGRRYYRPEDVRLLRGIRGLLYDDGMTIKGVQKILRERGLRHVVGLGSLAAEMEAEAAPPSVAAPRPARVPAPAGQPQGDLFGGGAAVAEMVEATADERPAAAGPLRPRDTAALRALVARLVALRAEMIAEPRR